MFFITTFVFHQTFFTMLPNSERFKILANPRGWHCWDMSSERLVGKEFKTYAEARAVADFLIACDRCNYSLVETHTIDNDFT